jgi:hypothetical protein
MFRLSQFKNVFNQPDIPLRHWAIQKSAPHTRNRLISLVEVQHEKVLPLELQPLPILRTFLGACCAWRIGRAKNRKHLPVINLVLIPLACAQIVRVLLAVLAINLGYLRMH